MNHITTAADSTVLQQCAGLVWWAWLILAGASINFKLWKIGYLARRATACDIL